MNAEDELFEVRLPHHRDDKLDKKKARKGMIPSAFNIVAAIQSSLLSKLYPLFANFYHT